MSSVLRGTKLIDLCTQSIAYDAQVQAACTAFDRQMFEIIDDTGQVIMIPNIMGIFDSNLIDILAWQFHVDFYDPTRDLDFRKRLVQMSIIWHRTKGTVALVEEVLNTYWPGVAFLQEWFEYKFPFPPNFPVVNADELLGSFRPQDVNLPNNKFTLPVADPLLAEDGAIFFKKTVPANALPSPLIELTTYYILNATTNSFQVAATPGGAAIDLTSQGTGEFNEIWAKGAPGGTWHDRYRFRVVISDEVDPAVALQVVELINRYKPVSRWLEDIVRSRASVCLAYVAAYAKIFTSRVSFAAHLR